MPDLQDAPKAIDWEHIQALYFQGKGPAEISRMTGVRADTISVRATRKGWAQLLQKTRKDCQAVTISVRQDKDESPKLNAQSDRTRVALADVIARSAEHLAQAPILSASRALRLNQDAESLVRNAKTVFGWSDNNTTPAVRLSVMMNTTFEKEPQQEHKPVIECEASKEPAQLPEQGQTGAS